jgi:hypothetical protein
LDKIFEMLSNRYKRTFVLILISLFEMPLPVLDCPACAAIASACPACPALPCCVLRASSSNKPCQRCAIPSAASPLRVQPAAFKQKASE